MHMSMSVVQLKDWIKRMHRAIWLAIVVATSTTTVCGAAQQSTPASKPQSELQARSETSGLPHRKFSMSICFDRADAENKEIRVATANLPIAQAAIVIAKAIPSPIFNLNYGWGDAWKFILAGNNQQVGWTEEVLVAGRRTKRTYVANATYLQTAFQIEATRFDVHNRVRRAYAEQAAAAAYEDLIESQRAIGQELLDIASKRYAAGKAPGSEVLQAKLAVAQFEIQRNQAQGRLVQDSAQLALLVGETQPHQEIIDVDENDMFKLSAQKGSSIVPSAERGVPQLEQLLPTAWRQRKDLKAAIQQAYAGRKLLTLAKTQRIPDPVIGFNYLFSTYQRFQPAFFDPRFGPVPQQPGYMLTVQEEMPLFYQYQGQVNQARATWMQQLKQNDLLRSQIATGIVAAYEALILSRANVETYQQKLLPAAANVARLARRGYELGKTDLATAILAQQQYQQLRSSYFDSVVAYQNAWADLEKAVGVPLNL